VLAQTLTTRAYRAHSPGVSGTGPPRALQKPGTWPWECREQAPQHRAALRAPAT
jgi:hypothetical protein